MKFKSLFTCTIVGMVLVSGYGSAGAVQSDRSLDLSIINGVPDHAALLNPTVIDRGEMIGKRAPNFALLNMKGETVSLEDYRGKILIINFWATWSRPCIDSFSGMQAAVNKYKDDPSVEFLFINTFEQDENYKEIVEKFIKSEGYTFNVAFDDMKHPSKSTVMAYGVTSIPANIFVDRKGVIRYQSVGGNRDVEQVVKEIDEKVALMRRSGGVQYMVK